ncbi:ribosome assembly RNA-binding protein YhbY [Desulfogranum marinum]|jgi:RNA-binding protein|uniref:ribosome assembly RNA-binding protein YhbY n=1 Tax=Desulfogranum marinum TaxID=453220 RepID=UPI001965A375|nr:ribosome assembly RNA-binding protein YhbY [Desulfogranum marinum]MBM9511316.1 ribosome assembly RNA-binding protein YhbY [Desulfogranum marinum]
MSDNDPKQSTLNVRQRKALRGLGHHLEPIVYVGKEGISATLIQAAKSALQAHELIKIKLGQNCPLPKKEAAEALAESTQADLVQLIGKMVLLFRPNPELPLEKKIKI